MQTFKLLFVAFLISIISAATKHPTAGTLKPQKPVDMKPQDIASALGMTRAAGQRTMRIHLSFAKSKLKALTVYQQTCGSDEWGRESIKAEDLIYNILSRSFSALDSAGYLMQEIEPKYSPTRDVFYWNHLNIGKQSKALSQAWHALNNHRLIDRDGRTFKIWELWNVLKHYMIAPVMPRFDRLEQRVKFRLGGLSDDVGVMLQKWIDLVDAFVSEMTAFSNERFRKYW